MLVSLDFLKRPGQMARRVGSRLSGETARRQDDDRRAVCAVLAECLQSYLLAFAGDEFLEARTR